MKRIPTSNSIVFTYDDRVTIRVVVAVVVVVIAVFMVGTVGIMVGTVVVMVAIGVFMAVIRVVMVAMELVMVAMGRCCFIEIVRFGSGSGGTCCFSRRNAWEQKSSPGT